MIVIDYKDKRPIYEQVIEKITNLIVRGILEPDTKLPSVRNFAIELSINPNTIQRAYTELERQGFIYSVKGKGNYVSSNIEVVNLKKAEVKDELKKIVEKAKDIGLTKEEFLDDINQCIEEVSLW